jgi:hypothetical protein
MERQQEAEGEALPAIAEGKDADRLAEWEKLNDTLRRIKETIQQVESAAKKLSESGLNPRQQKAELAGAGRARESAKECREALNQIIMDSTKAITNAEIQPLAESRKDEQEYAGKKRLVRIVNDALREQGAVLANPDTKEPCLLLAVNSRDGAGRYTLQSRITKKRTGSYTTLKDLLPLVPMLDVPRKEGVIEQRKGREEPLREEGDANQSWTQRITDSQEQDRNEGRSPPT